MALAPGAQTAAVTAAAAAAADAVAGARQPVRPLHARCTHARRGWDAERDGGAACTAPTVGLLLPIKEGPTGALLSFFFFEGGHGRAGGAAARRLRVPASQTTL